MNDVYKMFNGLDGINVQDHFDLDKSDRIRGHHLNIMKKSCKLELHNDSSLRVTNQWNALSVYKVWFQCHSQYFKKQTR